MNLPQPLTRQLIVLVALLVLVAPSAAGAIGSTPVTVVNSNDLAKAQGIQHPIQFVIFCPFASGSTACGGNFSVPASQRLIIEFVSVNCISMPAANRMAALILQVSNGANFTEYTLNLVDHSPIAGILTASQPMKVYADPGTTLGGVALTESGNTAATQCFFNVAGQAIDIP